MSSLAIGFLYLAPWLALLAVLVCGRYPGERVIARLRARLRRRRMPIVRSASPPRAPRVVASGGLLLAWRLAGRGPPAVA